MISLSSCSKDDDGTTTVEIRPRDEVQLEDDAELVTYLNTHFYNYEEFANTTNLKDFEIKFDSIAGEFADYTPLIDQVVKKSITFQDQEYTLYILKVNEGANTVLKPTYADSVYLSYKGNVVTSKLSENKFDLTVTPTWLSLAGTVPGFAQAVDELRPASGYSNGPDDQGVINFNADYGVGAMFIPSGLGYYSQSNTGIPSYSNLVFRFSLFWSVNNTDHDADGIPSYMEDINDNGIMLDDDTDEDTYSNYLDADDDGDGTPTADEIEVQEDGTIVFPDTDGDGTPDYLDKDNK